MHRQNTLMTITWLNEIVEEMKVLNEVWPYLTIKGKIAVNNQNQDASTLEEVIDFMKSFGYLFVSANSIDNSYTELVFKKN